MTSATLSALLPVRGAPALPGRRAAAVRNALAIAGAWTVYGCVHGTFWIATGEVRSSAWGWMMAAALILAWSWALLTPAIFRLTKTVAPARVGWLGSLVSHAVAFAVLAVGMAWLRMMLIERFTGESTGPFWPRVVFWLDVNLFTYLTVVLTGLALQAHRRYLDRVLRAHVLETQLARAQLHYLELQLQPHFLFNSLNAIQELAHEAPEAAERVLRRLHTLLAMSLERSGRDEVSLEDELAALEPYVDIQRTRFEWLNVGIAADAEARRALVPHLILQPLVENAIRHGLAVRRAPGRIEVIAERRGARLHLLVRDNGVGLAPVASRGRPGIGLRNAGERLQQLYGGDHSFALRDAPNGGVTVDIDIPFRAAPELARAASWSELGRSRETMPEIAVDDIALWRTGEFTATVSAPNAGAAYGVPVPRSDAPGAIAQTGGPAAPPEGRGLPDESMEGEGTTPMRTIRAWLALVGIWLGAATLWTGQIWFLSRNDPAYTSFDRTLLRLQAAGAAYWIAVSLGVLYLARRFRLHRRRMLPHLGIHLGAALVSSLGFLYVLSLPGLGAAPVLYPFNINPLSGNFFIYFGLLAWSHSRDFVAWYRAREVTAAELTSEIARSRFQALCVRVRPQFLLGTLDLLARLVHLDVPRADRLIARLADVLRLTLEMAREHVTTLQQELQLLGATVEAHRLGIRPGVSLDVDVAPAALATRMPSRLLCTMVDDLLGAQSEGAAEPLVIGVRAERSTDATRIRLHGDAAWATGTGDLHAWWRTKSAAEAAVAEAGPLVTVALPDRATAVLIIADERPAEAAAAVAA